jgi:hypothetical protein
MEKTVPDLLINKESIFTSKQDECKSNIYTKDAFIKRYSAVTSYEELEKYLPEDQLIHDTARYILDYHKKGLYVSFKNGKLKHFIFLNKSNFIAPYQDKIKINPYIKIAPNSKFRLTQCLLRTSDSKRELNQIDFYVMEILFFLKELEKNKSKEIPDCNFFINWKDQVLILKENNKYYNPFVDVFGKVPLEDEWQKCKLGNLFSFCTIKNYLDIPFISPDDIIRTYKIFSANEDNKCSNTYDHQKLDIDWKDKKEIAFWRGTSTGCGNDIYTNMRMKLAYLSNKWIKDSPDTSKQILDAKIVKWAYKLKKTEKDQYFNRINTKKLNSLGIDLGEKVPIEELYKYKYIINVDGNVAAYRLGFLFSLKAVVFIVEGKYKLWFQDKLVENKHYISIKADLSNLKEKIYWCKNHDKECEKIANNAYEFHENIFSKDNMFSYMIDKMKLLKSE